MPAVTPFVQQTFTLKSHLSLAEPDSSEAAPGPSRP